MDYSAHPNIVEFLDEIGHVCLPRMGRSRELRLSENGVKILPLVIDGGSLARPMGLLTPLRLSLDGRSATRSGLTDQTPFFPCVCLFYNMMVYLALHASCSLWLEADM